MKGLTRGNRKCGTGVENGQIAGWKSNRIGRKAGVAAWRLFARSCRFQAQLFGSEPLSSRFGCAIQYATCSVLI